MLFIHKIGFPIIAIGEIIVFYKAYILSTPLNPRYTAISRYLSDGWLGKMDLSDHQHRFFRNYLGILSVVMIIHTSLSYTYKQQFKGFTFIFCLLFLFVIHGYNAIKVLILLSFNYGITRAFGKTKFGVIGLWIWHITMILVMNQLDFDLPYFNGLISQWTIYYKFNILRMISFSMDYKWSKLYDTIERPINRRERIASPCRDYTYKTYLRYVLYPPLYLAGPIVTFNDFVHQENKINKNQLIQNRPAIIRYAMRFLAILGIMEIFSRVAYVNAISSDGKKNGFESYTSIELCIIGYLALMHIWLKLMILWRFFRLWAMMDGIETEENMTRCMSNNYSAMEFWKHWHKSFNKWTVRYLYIPLGGSKTYMWNIWIIFTFVAIWHDIELKLLIWAWAIALFILPEYLCKKVFKNLQVFHFHIDPSLL